MYLKGIRELGRPWGAAFLQPLEGNSVTMSILSRLRGGKEARKGSSLGDNKIAIEPLLLRCFPKGEDRYTG